MLRRGLLGELLVLLLAGCASAAAIAEASPTPTAQMVEGTEMPSAATAPVSEVEGFAPIPEERPNVRVEEEVRYSPGFSLGFDGIFPIYAPRFAPAEEAPLIDEELVIGVAWGGEAKAYPITVLRFREMVNDELAGVPTLVTW